MTRPLLLAALTIALALPAAVDAGPRPAKSKAAAAAAARVKHGQAFAEQRCAACHGVTRNSSSPNPESPTFEDIANRPGLTSTTLRQFLRDSHNFPEAMDFAVERERIRELADYIVTLRRADYKPTI